MPLLDDLNRTVQRVLHSARLEPQPLPLCPELSLYLLNADFSNEELSPEEAEAAMESPCYWIFCWASGQVLARYLLDFPEVVRGRVVVDFGTGSGVVAVAAMLAGARRVYACDVDPVARQACLLNAALNGVEIVPVDHLDDIEEPVDLLTVADVLYDRANLPLLPAFLACAPEVLLADSRLRHLPDEQYQRLGEWESSTVPDLDEQAEFRRVRVYRAARNGG